MSLTDQDVALVVLSREQAWSNFLRAGDGPGVDTILGAGYTNTDADTRPWDKDDDRNYCLTAVYKSKLSAPQIDPANIHVYNGDCAVVTGSDTIQGDAFTYHWTDTWVNISGQWRCVASHTSKIAQPAASK